MRGLAPQARGFPHTVAFLCRDNGTALLVLVTTQAPHNDDLRKLKRRECVADRPWRGGPGGPAGR